MHAGAGYRREQWRHGCCLSHCGRVSNKIRWKIIYDLRMKYYFLNPEHSRTIDTFCFLRWHSVQEVLNFRRPSKNLAPLDREISSLCIFRTLKPAKNSIEERRDRFKNLEFSWEVLRYLWKLARLAKKGGWQAENQGQRGWHTALLGLTDGGRCGQRGGKVILSHVIGPNFRIPTPFVLVRST
jgi:hypothetical protein